MKGSNELQVTSYRLLSKPIFYILHSALNLLLVTRYSLLVTFLLFTVHCSLFTDAWATTITADHLEYFKDEDKYVATGNVVIEKDDAMLYADKVILYQKTSDAEATGNVVYNDSETLINTERAELNLKTKTGKLHNAVIFFKKGNYWVNGDNVEKIKEDHYYATTATFTTCDSEPSENPDWCFKGSNVDIIVGKKLTASNVTYRIKGLPVLYSPYLWAPVKSERETGFLMPIIGNSSRKGFQFSPAFFWAIDDNKDATFYLDYYSKRGIGTGAEYRYLDFNNRGRWYLYHLKDKQLARHFYEFKGIHDHTFGNIKGYIDINYINHEDFYKEYAYRKDERIQRFLQSTGEISMPFKNSRAYLLGQYWIDLKDENARVPHRLPELGYTVNPVNMGPFMFTMTSNITNFFREKEIRGQRLDINPTLSYSFGNWLQVFQSLSLRETAYNLKNDRTYGSSPHRETFEYRTNALTRFIKKYESFTHTIEPSISYSFIPETHQLPLFDSVELFDKTSVATVSLYNSLAFRNFLLTASISQPLNFNAGDRPLQPTSISASISGPFSLSLSLSHDLNKGKTESINSDLSFKVVEGTTISFGEAYSNETERYYSRLGIDSVITKRWSAKASMSHDSRDGLRDATLNVIYTQQCWVVNASLARRPGDDKRPPEYSFMVFVELKGIGLFHVFDYQTKSQPSPQK